MDFKKIKVDTLFTVLLGVSKGDAWLCWSDSQWGWDSGLPVAKH